MLILSVVPASGAQPALNEWVRGVAAVLCALCGVGFLRTGCARQRRRARASRESRTARLSRAALARGCPPPVLVPVYLLAARTHASSEQWLGYGFFDKRWVVALFTLGTLGSCSS